ncbi:MAG: DPP IV N-terminal domain-containing protein, partial [Deltaproteobacteria bacterium]|nr:DPP IV N-terminal domain-containing protein [Deltaproteobacteria bacterium]
MTERTMKQVRWEAYERAEKYLLWNSKDLVRNAKVNPHWFGDKDFWYKRETENGKQFVKVDAGTGEKTPAFDHEKVATAFRKFAGEENGADITAEALPFDLFEMAEEGNPIHFSALGKQVACDLDKGVCTELDNPIPAMHEILSPDGKWTAYLEGDNLHVRSTDGDEKKTLTTDGEPHYAYGKPPGANTSSVTMRLTGIQLPPLAVWSPDSKKLFCGCLDERKVKDLHLLQHAPPDGSARPQMHAYRYPMPGDEYVAMLEIFVFDIETGTKVAARHPRVAVPFSSLVETQSVWWRKDGKTLYFIDTARDFAWMKLCEMDVATGDVRVLISESSDTFVRSDLMMGFRPNVRVLGQGEEIIWFSERDGWGHLYLYDSCSGALKNRITSGEWVVRDILHVDEKNRAIYFVAGGAEDDRDPYLRHIYKVELDGTRLICLTPEAADHQVAVPVTGYAAMMAAMDPTLDPTAAGFSPTCVYFVDSYSRIDQPAVSVLRSVVDGHVIATLENADISALEGLSYTWPEPLKVKARDGKTDIYGAIFFPSDFDPSKIYPVVDSNYPGPQAIRTYKTAFAPDFFNTQSLAELGFIAVTIDGFGKPYRSKAFHDKCYGKLEGPGGL